MKKTIELGRINLPAIIKVTDPCYSSEEWCCNETEILPGVYECKAIMKDCGRWDTRIAELSIRHIDHPNVNCSESFPWTVTVDSGQAGFFAAEDYEQNCNNDDWYKQVCEITLHDKRCGRVNNIGVVSESGYGDGAYLCFYGRDNKENIVAVKIFFIEGIMEKGDIVKWYDPAIDDYPKEEQESILNRRFKVIDTHGDIILIQEIDENGNVNPNGSVAEVYDNELEIIDVWTKN